MVLLSRSKVLAVLTPFVFLFLTVVNGELLCYSCITQAGGDQTCVTNPAGVTTNTPIVKCKYKYCTIRRLEYTKDPGMIYSFLRGCEDDPLPNGQNPGEDITVYAQSCNYGDLCNVGDGLTELTPGSGSGGNFPGDVIIVPGRGSAPSLKTPGFILLSLTLSVLFGIRHVLF